ncbi:MAG: hypothetical protein HYW26_02745 [Candidatus Aenigmarchaeota archaeon]|nr:hypothetical protein [Candidatus Aenigmarchaeota archaeon]
MKIEWELIASEIVPSLRSLIARELIEGYNLNQSEAARLMGISQPAISQYLRRIRGKNDRVFSNDEIISEARKLASVIFENKLDRGELNSRFVILCKFAAERSVQGKKPPAADAGRISIA